MLRDAGAGREEGMGAVPPRTHSSFATDKDFVSVVSAETIQHVNMEIC